MLQSLEEQLAKLTSDFEQATAEKMRCQQEADATNATIQLANRLVGGLASENIRWAESVAKYVLTFFKLKELIHSAQ
jgi:dynein heavy chain